MSTRAVNVPVADVVGGVDARRGHRVEREARGAVQGHAASAGALRATPVRPGRLALEARRTAVVHVVIEVDRASDADAEETEAETLLVMVERFRRRLVDEIGIRNLGVHADGGGRSDKPGEEERKAHIEWQGKDRWGVRAWAKRASVQRRLMESRGRGGERRRSLTAGDLCAARGESEVRSGRSSETRLSLLKALKCRLLGYRPAQGIATAPARSW